jgi:hypothetical protein
MFTLPVFPPKHAIITWVVVAAKAAAGWVMIAVAVAVHPFASETVTV